VRLSDDNGRGSREERLGGGGGEGNGGMLDYEDDPGWTREMSLLFIAMHHHKTSCH